MKTFSSLLVVSAVILTSGMNSFAMSSSDTSMKVEGSMQSDMMNTSMMMKSDSMVKTNGMIKMDYSKKSVSEVAKHYGYNWKADRMKLAKLAGVMNYRGTVMQNTKVKTIY